MSTRPPRPKGPSLFTLLDIGRDQLGTPIRYFDELGDTFAFSVMGTQVIASRDPAVFEEVLVRKHKAFIKDQLTRGLSRLLGQGLLTSDQEPWRKHRRILGPHFQASEIGRYLPAYREEAERELLRWRPGCAFDLHEAMARLSMRIALRTVFGSEADDLGDFDASMRDAMVFFTGVAGTGLTVPLGVPTPCH